MHIGRMTHTMPTVAPAWSSQKSAVGATDPAEADPNVRAHRALAPGDLDVIDAMVGYRPIEGGLMPISAFLISHDRQSGRLPTGAAITTDYLKDLATRVQNSDGTPSISAAQLDRATAFLDLHA